MEERSIGVMKMHAQCDVSYTSIRLLVNTLFQQHKGQHSKGDSTHGHHQMIDTEITDSILFSQQWRSSIQ